MKKQTVSLFAILLAISAAFTACNNKTSTDRGALEFDSIPLNVTEHLFGDTAKPRLQPGHQPGLRQPLRRRRPEGQLERPPPQRLPGRRICPHDAPGGRATLPGTVREGLPQRPGGTLPEGGKRVRGPPTSAPGTPTINTSGARRSSTGRTSWSTTPATRNTPAGPTASTRTPSSTWTSAPWPPSAWTTSSPTATRRR